MPPTRARFGASLGLAPPLVDDTTSGLLLAPCNSVGLGCWPEDELDWCVAEEADDDDDEDDDEDEEDDDDDDELKSEDADCWFTCAAGSWS